MIPFSSLVACPVPSSPVSAERWPANMKFPGQHQFAFSSLMTQICGIVSSIIYLTERFCWVTKNNDNSL